MASQDGELNRALGRVEGELAGIVATLKRVDDRSAKRDDLFQEVVDRLGTLEDHAERTAKVAVQLGELQQMVRDGRMQGKGILVGFGLATAAGGATLAAFFKSIWISLFGV